MKRLKRRLRELLAAGRATEELSRLRRKLRRRVLARPRRLEDGRSAAGLLSGYVERIAARHGSTVARWAELRFLSWYRSRGYEYADNFRLALLGDPSEERAYQEAQRRGCCGRLDVEATFYDGRRFRLGCNYGH